MTSVLQPGDVAIVSYNSDDPDAFAFAVLQPVTSGTVISFTDQSWNGSSFTPSGTDSTITFTATSSIPAGTVIRTDSPSFGTFSGSLNLDDTGDTIFAYQGTVASPTFLYAIELADGNSTFDNSLSGTGLTAGVNAVAVAGDNGTYGDVTTGTAATLLAKISDNTNWIYDDNSPHPMLTGPFFSAPDQVVYVAAAGDPAIVHVNRDGTDTGTNEVTLYQNDSTLNHPNDIVFDTVHGLYFFADSDTGNRRILQGNIADLYNPGVPATFKVLYSDQSTGVTGGQINGLAIDIDATTGVGALYFVNQGNFEKITYSHDGNSSLSQTPTLLAQLPAGSFANEIALDLNNNRGFVLSTATNTQAVAANQGDPGAQYDPDSGTYYVVQTVVSNNEIWQVSGLDRTDTSTAQTSFARLDLDPATANGGSGAGAADGTGYDLPSSSGILESIDVDPTSNLLYFTTQQTGGGTIGTGGVYTYNLQNGTIANLYGETGSQNLGYIDVDPASGRYYVSNTEFDSSVNNSSILIHPLSAGTPTTFAPVNNQTASQVPWGLTVDNAPTLILTPLGTTPTYTETAGSPSAAGTAVGLITSDSASDLDTTGLADQLAGATVRISNGFLSGASHQDTLTFMPSGGISGSYDSTTGVLTLSGPATFGEYQTVLQSVGFTSSGDNPTDYGTDTSRTIAWSVSDGLLSSDEQTTTLTVVGTNDAPVISVGAGNTASLGLTETNGGLSQSGTLTVTDPDSTSQTITTSLGSHTGPVNGISDATLAGFFSAGSPVSTSPPGATGTLTYTFNSGSEAFNYLRATQQLAITYNIHDVDSADTGTSAPIDQQVVVTITGTNDAPSITGSTNPGTFTEATDASAQAVSGTGSLSVSDLDVGDALTGSVTGSGTASLNSGAVPAQYTANIASLVSASDLSFATGVQSNGGTQTVGYTYANSTGANLDFLNSTDTLTISFQAQIGDGTTTSGTQPITITINGTNDAPAITSDGGGDNATVNVPENTTAVTTVAATDPDEGATQSYSILNTAGTDFGSFSIDSATGALSFTSPPDYEAPTTVGGGNSYVVDVQASDGSLTDTQTITVNVTDQNDNAPVITTAATQTVAENTTVVADLTSTDADTVGTNPASFSIIGGADAGRFTVATVGGVQQLQFVTAPDFEADASAAGSNTYQVQVTANDGTNTTPELITVNVTDQNDNAPVITTAPTQSVAENTTVVADLTSTDADTVGTNPASFSVTGGGRRGRLHAGDGRRGSAIAVRHGAGFRGACERRRHQCLPGRGDGQ